MRSRGRALPLRFLGARGGFLYVTGVKWFPSSSLVLVDGVPDIWGRKSAKHSEFTQARVGWTLAFLLLRAVFGTKS